MKSGILSILCFCLGLVNLFAQLNESDTAKIQLRTSLSGNYQKGNLEVFTLRTRLDFLAGSVTHLVFKTQNSSLYQSFYSKKADNDLFSRNFLYWKPNGVVYPFAIAFVSTNFRRKIDLRYFGGLGGTVHLLKNQKNSVKFSTGAVYEQTQFALSIYNLENFNGAKTQDALRVNTYLSGWHYILEKRIRIFYEAFWQPSVNQRNDYRYQADFGLEFPLWKGLSFSALYSFAHENLVIKNVKQDDQFLTFGFSYNYKKQH